MEPEEVLTKEIMELTRLIEAGHQRGEPKHILKMYQSLIKTKQAKLKQLKQLKLYGKFYFS